VFPRLGTNIFREIINANVNQSFPEYSKWRHEDRHWYQDILGPVIMALGYAGDDGGAPHGPDLATRTEEYAAKRQAARKRLLERRNKGIEVESLAEIDFRRCQPGQFFSAGCKLRVVEKGLVIVPSGKRHTLFVIGGGSWYQLEEDQGWVHHIGTYVRGWLEAACEGEGFFQLFCLMFDERGAQIGKRSLGQFGQGDERFEFSCRPLHEANRFALAVYGDAKSSPKRVALQRLVVEKVQG
jgi:hypothetical protein